MTTADKVCPNCGSDEVSFFINKLGLVLEYYCMICKTDWPNEYAKSEIRVTDPDTGGQKGKKPQRYSLVPWNVIEQLSEHYASGAEKYDEHNWRRGYTWSLSFDALMRHLKAWWEDGEDIDVDRGSHHLCAVIFHALALLEFTKTHPEKDDRYISKEKNASSE